MSKQDVLDAKYKNDYEYHKAKKPTNQTLVCIAGATEGCYRFYESLPVLTKYFNVVLFNNPGVGESSEEMVFTVEDLAVKFQHILNLLEIDSYYILGHSMGGFTAQRIALKNPQKVNKLVLIGTSFGSFQSEEDGKRILDLKKAFHETIPNIQNHNRAVKMEDYSFTQEFQKNNPKVIKKYLEEKLVKYKLPKRVIISHFMCGGRFSSLGETSRLLMPTLTIHGTEDKMVNIEGGILLAKTIPNSRMLTIKGAGHTAFIENVNIMEDVADFILNDAKLGETLEKDFIISEDMLEKDELFRKRSITESNFSFIKDFFMFDEVETNVKTFFRKLENFIKR
ncbi:MAG: alpha/beta hydrolase [Proteobacteria bacterium]|nr:alpha/beta hydrolase [Pseudomonadota bacterium]